MSENAVPLPAAPVAPAAVPVVAPVLAATPTPTYTLLLVDDEPSVLGALRRLFRNPSYRVLQASSGEDALAVLALEPVDLVISDMRMPEMDGAQLLDQVRQRHPNVTRLLLTGYADIASTIAAINRGEIQRYIAKPWDDADLLLIVRDALARKELEVQNRELLRITQQQNAALAQLNQTLEDRVQARVAEIKQVADMLDASYDELNQTFTVAMAVFAGMLEMRQDGMAGHSRRVAELARRVAVRLQFSANAENEVYLAALLHDIGKLGFPDAMLGKPTSMYTPEEITRYHRHPEAGEAALMPLPKLHGVAHLIRQHHERPDGYGFPDGLIGHQIQIGALVIAAASDYDGLVNGGAAPQRYSMQHALDLMLPLAGKHYDKAVMAALDAVVREIEPPPVNEYLVLPHELKAGMKLARDLLTPKGTLLLPKGLMFNVKLILQVQKFASSAAVELALYMVKDRVAPPQTPDPTPALAPSVDPAALVAPQALARV